MVTYDEQLAELHDLFSERGSHLSPTEAKLLLALKRHDRSVSINELMDALWGDDPSGGPLSAGQEIRVMVSKCRRRIEKTDLAWSIKNTHGFGYRLVM